MLSRFTFEKLHFVLVITFTAVIVNSAVYAAEIPDLNVKKSCNQIALAGGIRSEDSFAACMKNESEARLTLVDIWREVPREIIENCSNLVSGDHQSYGVLEACIGNEIFLKKRGLLR